MAKMVPPVLPSHADGETPNSERRIFNLLQTGPFTGEWWVLPGVKVPGVRRYSNPREIDFLIMVPGGGVVCLEVKGDSYTVRDGQWYRASGRGMPEPESPDKQAEHAMDALKNHLPKGGEWPGL